jgi:hypothetical protein
VPRHPQPINGEELFDYEDVGYRPHHAGVVKELTVLWVDMSSAVELVLGRSPGDASRVEVMNELTAKFQKLEGL